MSAQVVVVGGGPAGLAAAAAAAGGGAQVLVFEERGEAGGQLCYRVQPVATPESIGERPGDLARRLIGEAVETGAEIRRGAAVAGWFPENELLVVEADGASRLRAEVLIVATGSTDLPYPFPGATLPGVFSGRGVQILLHRHRVLPGYRFAVIGGGDEAEELVGDIQLAGGEVVWAGVAPAPFLRAIGADAVSGLMVGQDEYAVDVIAIAVGRQPDAALATMAGAAVALSPALGGFTPSVDDRMQSTRPGLFVAGDAAGVGSVVAAIGEGRIAGLAAAQWLGLIDVAQVEASVAARGPELEWRAAVRATFQTTFAQPYS